VAEGVYNLSLWCKHHKSDVKVLDCGEITIGDDALANETPESEEAASMFLAGSKARSGDLSGN
jgi:hypothetical protein